MSTLVAALPSFVILVLSLSFHEAAHAWTADRLGDPTARMLGRLTLNPLAHIDWIGTVVFPLVAMLSGIPLIGWAKPVPVSERNLKRPVQDMFWIALAGPLSNILLAAIHRFFNQCIEFFLIIHITFSYLAAKVLQIIL